MNRTMNFLITGIASALLLSGCGSAEVNSDYADKAINNVGSTTAEGEINGQEDLTLADNKGITEYKWYVGAGNPLFKYSSEYLTSVRPEVLTINRSRGRSSYDTYYNVELNTELFLHTSVITVTGIYPSDNYITFTMKKVKTGPIDDFFNQIN